MDEYAGMLSRVASTYEANHAVQQELFQEICIAIWQSLKRFKGDANIKTYILKIAHNRGVSHVSKEVRAVKTSSDEDALADAENANLKTTLEHAAIQSQQVQVLLKQIRDLSLPARQVITLSLEGLSYEDISDVTGLTKSNVGVSIKRIKAQLKGAVADE